jgi:hypothetical protein
MMRWRHKARQRVYTEVGRGSLQSGNPIAEGTELVAYRDADGLLWFRPVSEFTDGRFESLPNGKPLFTYRPSNMAASANVCDDQNRQVAIVAFTTSHPLAKELEFALMQFLGSYEGKNAG